MNKIIKDLLSMIQKRTHSKPHLNAILAKYQGYDLQKELDRYLDTLMEAESRTVDYVFMKKYGSE